MPSLIRLFSLHDTPSSSTGLLPSLPRRSPLSIIFILWLITFSPNLPDRRDFPFCTFSDESNDANIPMNSVAIRLSRIICAFWEFILFEPNSCKARLAAFLPTSSEETSFRNLDPERYQPICLSFPSSARAIICAMLVVERY